MQGMALCVESLTFAEMNVLVVMDSFKGSLTSRQAEEAVAEALGQRWPGCAVTCVPISDGGGGMLGALLEARGGQVVRVACHDPLMRSLEACYGIIKPSGHGREDGGDDIEDSTEPTGRGNPRSLGDVKGTNGNRTEWAGEGSVDKDRYSGAIAVVEMAEASGLSRLEVAERNPLLTNTYGTGELIRHALDCGLRRFIVGLGGSATCDAGLGMMQALGAKLLDAEEQELPACGGTLERVARIDLAGLHPALQGATPMGSATFTVACDVGNPFTGPRGAARVFGPQKGADSAGVEALERGMEHVRKLILAQTGVDLNHVAGAGAAGGLGGAFVAWLGAELRSGIDLLMDVLGLEAHIRRADLVITGEGKADRQTLMGKVPLGVLRRARRQGVPVVLMAGQVEDADMLCAAGFAQVIRVTPASQPLAEAMRPEVARRNIAQALAGLNPSRLT